MADMSKNVSKFLAVISLTSTPKKNSKKGLDLFCGVMFIYHKNLVSTKYVIQIFVHSQCKNNCYHIIGRFEK